MRRAATLAAVAVTACVLAGCTNPDAPAATRTPAPKSGTGDAGEPASPPPPAAVSQAPFGVRPTPQRALAWFADRYINWSYRTLTTDQAALAAAAVGAARLSERQAATESQSDTAITHGQIWNHGQTVSISHDLARPGAWVVVTREETGGNTEYAGLPAAYHVTLAGVAAVPGGWAVSRWEPQS